MGLQREPYSYPERVSTCCDILGRVGHMKPGLSSGDGCRISLIVAMRNEESCIGECLGSLLAQDLDPSSFEVLACDGESTDGTWQIAENMLVGHRNCRLLHNPKVTQTAAWNLGIEESRGELIGIVSGHALLAPDYVSQVLDTHARTGADLVGGPMSAVGQNRTAEAVALATSTRFGMGGAKFHYANREEFVDTVYMGVCRRSVYEKVGGFDEELVRDEDDELSYRIREHGGRIVCNPAIRSKYYNRASLGGLWKQYFQYGLWKVRVLQKHPKQMRPRQFVPPLFALSLFVVLGLWLLASWGWVALVVVGGSYVLANLAASVLTAARKGWRHLPPLPVVYAILHLSYGLGFLAGLFKFWNRWGDKKGKVPEFKPREEGE
jgi:succinoglycan biosynthesis protein ExoA